MIKILQIKLTASRKHTNYTLCFIVLSFLKVGATTFYVSDNFKNGDLYTTTIGNDSNYDTCTSSIFQTTIN